MSLIAKDLPTLIFLLLPGFISAGVYYTLTAHPKTSEFERIVQSLIFTAFVRISLHLVKPLLFHASMWRSFGRWSADIEFDWSVALAIVLGLVFALFSNRDLFHRFSRAIGMSSRTSYPSEWYSAFTNNKNRYVRLYLDGDRKLRGWPEEWPDQPDKGYFILANPEWILGDQIAPLYKAKRFLVPASEVKMVEFLLSDDELTISPQEADRIDQLLLKAEQKPGVKDGSESTATPTQ